MELTVERVTWNKGNYLVNTALQISDGRYTIEVHKNGRAPKQEDIDATEIHHKYAYATRYYAWHNGPNGTLLRRVNLARR